MRKIAIFILFFALLAHGANAQTSSASMEQLAQTLAKGLKSEKAKGKQIRLDYFTLDETQMGSPRLPPNWAKMAWPFVKTPTT
jgi:predicted alpha/beta-hydrolase family hydrolase